MLNHFQDELYVRVTQRDHCKDLPCSVRSNSVLSRLSAVLAQLTSLLRVWLCWWNDVSLCSHSREVGLLMTYSIDCLASLKSDGPGAFDFIQGSNSSEPQNPFWEIVKGIFGRFLFITCTEIRAVIQVRLLRLLHKSRLIVSIRSPSYLILCAAILVVRNILPPMRIGLCRHTVSMVATHG